MSDEPARGDDLGLVVLERAFEALSDEPRWSVRGEREFTVWAGWNRQRVWAETARQYQGETIWHIRSSSPVYRDLADEEAACAFVNEQNESGGIGAWIYDPDERTISLRAGILLYDDVAHWLGTWLAIGSAIDAAIAWGMGPAAAEGRALDEEAHPESGRRADPAGLIGIVQQGSKRPAWSGSLMAFAASRLAGEGFGLERARDGEGVVGFLPLPSKEPTYWLLTNAEHPLLGWGLLVRHVVPERWGPKRGAWLANALNLAESADWAGDERPHALGAWYQADDARLHHLQFVPGRLVDDVRSKDAHYLARNLYVTSGVRGQFFEERLGWLRAAACARYPDDEPAPEEADGPSEAPDARPADDDTARWVPWAERSFGPAVRVRRPAPVGARSDAPRTHLVDPSDPSAHAEIDAAVAVAEDGDTIRVRPGIYRTPVLLDRAVAIEGEGDVDTIVLEPVGGECVGFTVSGASVRGLTIRPSRAGNDGAEYSAVAVHDVSALVEDCRLSTHLGATAWIGGPGSLAVFRDCRFTEGAQNAVFVCEEGRAEVLDCEVRAHAYPIVVRGPRGRLRIERSTLADNLAGGIGAEPSTLVEVRDSRIARNAGPGVMLNSVAPASVVSGCTFEGNLGGAIALHGGTGVEIERNRIERNVMGIAVGGTASPRIARNELIDNEQVAIGVEDELTDPIVVDNTIRSRPRALGIVVRRGANGTFERNRLTGGDGAGILIENAPSAPVFRSNFVSGGSGVAIRVADGAAGTYEANDLRGNHGGSWRLDGPGELDRTGNLEDAGRGGSAPESEPEAPAGGRLN